MAPHSSLLLASALFALVWACAAQNEQFLALIAANKPKMTPEKAEWVRGELVLEICVLNPSVWWGAQRVSERAGPLATCLRTHVACLPLHPRPAAQRREGALHASPPPPPAL